ncbi:hypothetical protein CGSHi22121_09605 [Haemophilus influenzae 22.1-21]|uniref:Uncharacterized protein n=2 Tax=Haemophilus influenzae TaxID=727 RepID=A5UFP2_HAEIG|nr:hypothetical protein CGSHiGG_02925 [Haemophilus influenzae PittGG]EDJ88273.1 hypothetical protein CGSHi22121_09605 [Haemophilus influenzae 22.1-21]EDK11100.1 hypothetical protein CGSHiII_08936 [Haemophilus influenzae PittII]EDK13030.1 hypothetical protein CGSHiR3021_11139 [Haemophilus influenzae 22.4-21]
MTALITQFWQQVETAQTLKSYIKK